MCLGSIDFVWFGGGWVLSWLAGMRFLFWVMVLGSVVFMVGSFPVRIRGVFGVLGVFGLR